MSLVAAACADDSDDEADDETTDDEEVTEDTEAEGAEASDLEGEEVTVYGPEIDTEQQSLNESFEPFREDTGVDVQVDGADDSETQIVVDVEGGNPPDIAMLAQPGLVQDFAEDITPLSGGALEEVEANFDEGWTSLVEADGELLGVPVKADLKSLIWYSPAAFADAGYEIPETFEDFVALTDQMMEDGNTPFCVGWESDDATGWPATDWLEDWVLRMHGPEVYDEWRTHEIPFNDERIVESAETLNDLWSQDGAVYGGFDAAASTSFRDAGIGVSDGDCMMYRMSNFYGAIYGENDVEIGPEADVSAFYLPGSEENPNVTLTAGLYAVAFNDDPATMATLEYLASTDFADARASNEIGGFLSPNANVDASLYPTPLEQEFGQILADADPARFDASDLMPGEVGSGTFWEAMIEITAGNQTPQEAFDSVEDSWRE